MDGIPVDPADPCPVCKHELDNGYPLVSVELGEIQVGSKSGQLMFMTEDFPLGFFHKNCLESQLNGLTIELRYYENSCRCVLCGDELQQEPIVFRVTVGEIQEHESKEDIWLFKERTWDSGDLMAGDLCEDCLVMNLGDGDSDAGRELLGID